MTQVSAIGLHRFDMARGQSFDRHVHDAHQLAWVRSGVLMVEAENRYWVLPPTLALWLPAGVWHVSIALRESVMQGIYLEPDGCPLVWDVPTVVSVSPLAHHLIEYLAGEVDDEARTHAETVLLEVLRPIEEASIELPLPVDERAREVAELLLTNPRDQRSLEQLARAVRSSPRTLLRLFLTDTGMTFNQWRVQSRLYASMAYLAEGQPVARVADQVGYATASAFVAAFHRVTGHTPAAYFGTAGTRPDRQQRLTAQRRRPPAAVADLEYRGA